MTDIVLSEFVSTTGVEPAVAQDILDSHEWDLQAALRAFTTIETYKSFKGDDDVGPLMAKLADGPPANMEVARNVPVGRPLLKKDVAVEVPEETTGRKWSRGISRASENLALVTRARNEVAKGFTLDDLACVPNHTFALPDLAAIQPEDFRAFVENDLIETATLVSLEQAGRLNWWSDTKPCQRLLPLATTGDGNCLLHAASLGIWGFHDRLLTLRKSLNHVLSKSEYEASIYRRWRWHQTILNKQSGLVYTESEWDKEWFGILKLSSAEPRMKANTYICCDNSPNRNPSTITEEKETDMTSNGCCMDDYTQYESLEEVHVFALAYAIKRPVIVIADVYLRDSVGEPLAPIPFGGIYLPLGCDPKHCLRSPLVLTYDAAHFSALVPMKKEPPEIELPAVIPVTDSHGDLLPILFLVDPGESFQWGQEENDPQVIHKLSNISREERLHVLLTYLDLVKVTITPKPKDSVSGGSSGVDDRRSTADSNESESSSGGKSDSTKKSGLGRHMKSVRQKLKRSISKLTRRTSEENDVGLAKGNQGGTMEKNCVRAKSNERSNGEVSVSVNDVEVRIGGNENGAVSENASFVWKVDTVKDAQCAGHLANPNVVLGSPLCLDHETSFHEQMINNYLLAARDRYTDHSKDRERRGNLQLSNGMTRCANHGCDFFGTVATNYLCPNCFNKQKLQLEEMKAQRETTTIGKSTFYANANKGDNLPDIQENGSPLLNNQRSALVRNEAVRSSTLPQLPKPNSMELERRKFFEAENKEDFVVKPCTTTDCVFFGHEKSDFLCSQCYRNKKACLAPEITSGR